MDNIEKFLTAELDQPETFDALQHRAAEAVITANIDPSLITEEQHTRVTSLQSEAARLAMEANLLTPHLRRI